MDSMIISSYIKAAIITLQESNTEITIKVLEKKLEEIIRKRKEIIIAYAKIAINNINNSANEVTLEEIDAQVECIEKLYSTSKLIEVAKKL